VFLVISISTNHDAAANQIVEHLDHRAPHRWICRTGADRVAVFLYGILSQLRRRDAKKDLFFRNNATRVG
jgi:hypothetical protein